jgi:catechol 2,3-dioxygenase-like lactoylglutathione lyase family enzyme
VEIDHLILKVTDPKVSIEFYGRVLGFGYEGDDGPFAVLRVSRAFTLQLVKSPQAGGEHLAFSMTAAQFESVLETLRVQRIPFGGAFDAVGQNGAPGFELGARGKGPTVYFFDPDRHLLEVRHYTR